MAIDQLPEFTTTDHRHKGYRVQLFWTLVNGRRECVGVSLWGNVNPIIATADGAEADAETRIVLERGRGEPTPLTATDIRVPLGTFVSKGRARTRPLPLQPTTPNYARLVGVIGDVDEVAEFEVIYHEEVIAARFGLRGWTSDHLLKVAATYKTAWANGKSPTAAVAKKFDVSKSTAAKWVARCRTPEVGLLGETEKGVAGLGATKRKRAKP